MAVLNFYLSKQNIWMQLQKGVFAVEAGGAIRKISAN